MYVWHLWYTSIAPAGVSPASGRAAPLFDPDQNASTLHTPVWCNVPTPFVDNANVVGIPCSHFNTLPAGRFYAQLVVEQLEIPLGGGAPTHRSPTRQWAASRGTWFGVVQ